MYMYVLKVAPVYVITYNMLCTSFCVKIKHLSNDSVL